MPVLPRRRLSGRRQPSGRRWGWWCDVADSAHCQRRFTTIEVAALNVVKRSGVVEPFRRDKIVSGVRKSMSGDALSPTTSWRFSLSRSRTPCAIPVARKCRPRDRTDDPGTVAGSSTKSPTCVSHRSIVRSIHSLISSTRSRYSKPVVSGRGGANEVPIDITEGHKRPLATVVQRRAYDRAVHSPRRAPQARKGQR